MPWYYYKNLFCWAVIHATHWSLYVANLLSIVYISAYAPWYYALPLVTMSTNPIIGGMHCAFNNIENTYRMSLGWPLIEQNFLPQAVADVTNIIIKWKLAKKNK